MRIRLKNVLTKQLLVCPTWLIISFLHKKYTVTQLPAAIMRPSIPDEINAGSYKNKKRKLAAEQRVIRENNWITADARRNFLVIVKRFPLSGASVPMTN